MTIFDDDDKAIIFLVAAQGMGMVVTALGITIAVHGFSPPLLWALAFTAPLTIGTMLLGIHYTRKGEQL